jgi:hypothetical protein
MCDDRAMDDHRLGRRFVASIPERVVRSAAAVLGGALHETGALVLPRFVRRSRFYEATAKNLLRVAIEGVGGVKRASPAASPRDSTRPQEGVRAELPSTDHLTARELAKRKGAGNVVELSSIAAFGFSPLWLLAAASDLLRGSRVYLNALVSELKRTGVVADDAEFGSVEELLSALERGTGRTARMIDIPPLELAELRASVDELRADAGALPSPDEVAAAYRGLVRTAERERRPLLEVSTGVGMAFLTSARHVGREHVVVPYREDWRPLRREGFAAYARRVAAPYARAAASHFDAERPTWTERLIGRVSRDV